jgi:cell division septation protein DedD
MPTPELYKDKVEVSLDGRQIFYLFFGGAAIVGLVFVLGVMVGRRVEARGHLDRAETQTASDPLAALDRLERSDNLSFHGALTGTEAPTDVEKAIRARSGDKPEARPEAKVDAKVDAKVEAKPEAVKVEAKPEKKPEAKADKVEAKADKVEAKADKVEAKADKPEAKADKEARVDKDADRKAEKHDADKHDDKKAKKHDDDEKSEKDRAKYTLQLSSFQDKAEAEALLGSLKAAGYQAYLTTAEVTGKGTFYRVRLGSYRSVDAANDAKAELDRTAHRSAQVMRL